MSQATYLRDEYTAKILSAAQEIGDNYYYLPTEKLRIRLKSGVSLIDWVERWVDHRYRNVTIQDTKLINKWKR